VLESGETIRQSWLANRAQSEYRAVGGRLYLTNLRLAFEPHVVEVALGGKGHSLLLTSIASVGLQPGEFGLAHLFDGGLRTRLRVDMKSGAPEYFVVENVEEIQRLLSEAVASSATDRNA
jgi:hypothetical protein